jgi:hypothetical protein
MQVVGLSSSKRYAELRNFLLAGAFVTKDTKGRIVKAQDLEELISAIRTRDLTRMRHLFSQVSSFNSFLNELKRAYPIRPEDVKSIANNAVKTYSEIAELCAQAIEIVDEGIYLTPDSPPPADFAPIAIQTYRKLKKSEDYVLTGVWLEELARKEGIHPIHARDRLNESRTAGFLERYTEGSRGGFKTLLR